MAWSARARVVLPALEAPFRMTIFPGAASFTRPMETSFALKEEGREVDEVVAPDEGDVAAGGFDGGDGEAFGLEVGDELAIGFEEAVGGAAGDPEEAEVGGLLGGGGLEDGELGGGVEEMNGA